MTADPVIAARALEKSYDNRHVLEQLDLTVERGSSTGLVGANGAGKTTLLKCLVGLVPTEKGRCTVLGEPSSRLTAAARARLSYVPQTLGQFGWLTGQQMLSYIGAFYPAFDWKYANELAARWKLALHCEICLLSPGQQQRLSVVRALSTRPDVLILDEPVGSLDPATRIAVIDELIAERVRRGLTVIISSHIVADLERLCTKLAVLCNGRIGLMQDVQWFRQLARVKLDGDESLLTQMSIPSAIRIRKPQESRRIITLERSAIDRLSALVPLPVRMTLEAPDLEGIVSEWMQ